MAGIFIAPVNAELGGALESMDRAFREYTTKAARGECSWVCADCCCTFHEGMPDACVHGHQSCTDIIVRDKAEAMSAAHQATKEPSK